MKPLLTFLGCLVGAAVLSLSSAGCSRQNSPSQDASKPPQSTRTNIGVGWQMSNPHLGAWDLPQFPYLPAGTPEPLASTHRVLEIVVPDLFVCVEFETRSNRMTRAAGGRWHAEGPQRIATVEFVGGPGLENALGLRVAGPLKEARPSAILPTVVTTPTPHPLWGAWTMSSSCYDGGTNFVPARSDTTKLKLIAPGWFAWVEYDHKSQRIAGGAAGRCSVDEAQTTETIDVIGPDMEGYSGQSFRFTDRVTGDQLLHSGVIEGTLIQELWRRCDAAVFAVRQPETRR